jgi:hypothetical protein
MRAMLAGALVFLVALRLRRDHFPKEYGSVRQATPGAATGCGYFFDQ